MALPRCNDRQARNGLTARTTGKDSTYVLRITSSFLVVGVEIEDHAFFSRPNSWTWVLTGKRHRAVRRVPMGLGLFATTSVNVAPSQLFS